MEFFQYREKKSHCFKSASACLSHVEINLKRLHLFNILLSSACAQDIKTTAFFGVRNLIMTSIYCCKFYFNTYSQISCIYSLKLMYLTQMRCYVKGKIVNSRAHLHQSMSETCKMSTNYFALKSLHFTCKKNVY